MMRNTVYCLVEGDSDHNAIEASVEAMVERYRPTCPDTGSAAGAVRDVHPRQPLCIPETGRFIGTRVTVLLEVTGAAHYLPAYAGNLDIMTSAANATAERIATQPADRGSLIMTTSSTSAMSRCATACTPSATSTASNRRDDRSALDAAGVDSIEVAHGDGLAGSTLHLRVRRADRPGVDRGRRRSRRSAPGRHAAAARHRHYAQPQGGPRAGATVVRVATHCTEADISAQHIAAAREPAWTLSAS